MYEHFFGFKEKPFNNNPDPRFFFPSSRHSEALDRLFYAVQERKGFVVITGEIGAGKTTVCRALLNKLDDKSEVCMITNTHLSTKELILAILEDLGVEYKSGTKVKLLSQLNDYLIKMMNDGKNVVLIIDEAQNLTPSVLEEVRMLSNLETNTEKLIQIILMGQPELKEKLKLKQLEQFKQRIAVHYHLYPLTKHETADYVHHRVKVASQNDALSAFNKDALELVYEFSKGVPRLINFVCDNALLSGFVYERNPVDRAIVEEVIKESSLDAGAEPVAKVFCCPKCENYNNCQTRWIRGEKGEEQVCCEICSKYHECHPASRG